jgi:hypothetical protein
VLTEYLRHYNSVRPHSGLDLQPPSRAGGLTLVKAPPTTKPPIQRIDVSADSSTNTVGPPDGQTASWHPSGTGRG